MKNISVVIIAKNEEKVITDCISSVSFANEVLVIDAESTDATRSIATNLGARVITHPWQGYGKQKNFGAKHAKNQWILFLDADERVSGELQSDIAALPETPEQDVYWITVEDVFLGRRMTHIVGHNPRLVRKDAATWNGANVHEQLIYTASNTPVTYKDGVSGEIGSPIIHQSYSTIAAYLKKNASVYNARCKGHE